MKELSIKEKAKRYDESRERMKDFLKEWENCGALGEAMEKANAVFPELKEWFEDEKIINRIKKAVEEYWSDEPLDEILAWLEKHRVQPRQEWSKNDLAMYAKILFLLKSGVLPSTKECNKLSDWLKFLEYRNTWKPSDVQMEVLLSEANAWTKGCPKQKILKSLYDDLKKLREE